MMALVQNLVSCLCSLCFKTKAKVVSVWLIQSHNFKKRSEKTEGQSLWNVHGFESEFFSTNVALNWNIILLLKVTDMRFYTVLQLSPSLPMLVMALYYWISAQLWILDYAHDVHNVSLFKVTVAHCHKNLIFQAVIRLPKSLPWHNTHKATLLIKSIGYTLFQ